MLKHAAPEPYYVAYIDEAGDPGIRAVRPIDASGGTEWLCLGAVVVRASRDPELSDWVTAILQKAGVRNRSDLHYRDLAEFRKGIVCTEVAKLPLRGFVLASNKKNMRGYRNTLAEKVSSQQWFYNYCLRLLLERITHFCYSHARRERGDGRLLKLVFSERGGHSYGQTIAYHELLKNQSKAGKLYLAKHRIMWEVLDWRLAEARSHKNCHGAQIADIVASAFYQAVDTAASSKFDNSYAKRLKPIMAKREDTFRDYGIALQPTPPSRANLNDNQKKIFEYYDYKFWP